MLAHCPCCWANFNPALVRLLVFVWISLCLRDTPGPGFLLSCLLLYGHRHLASVVEPLTRWYLSDIRTTISRPLRRRQISCAARLRAVMRTGSLCIVSGTWFLSSCCTSGRWQNKTGILQWRRHLLPDSMTYCGDALSSMQLSKNIMAYIMIKM